MNVHFISIGGSVMHQLALALHRKGYQVTGSDDEIFEPAYGNLQRAGLLPAQMGWNAENINPELDAVILGMHARANNPELLKAQELGLPIYSFPEYIYQESQQKRRVVIGGSHGKTTTTSMLMHVLATAGLSFDYLVGARLEGFSQSVNITDAPILVAEGDEYPASALQPRPKFHFLYPHIAILTGIAWDHINVFPTFENYLEQFAIFIQRIEPGGLLIYNQTDEELTRLVQQNLRQDIRYQPYGLPAHSLDNGVTTLNIEGAVAQLQVFGQHNLHNLHAAWFAAKELGVTASSFVQAMGSFTGAAKRLEIIAQSPTAILFRDFAHAPSKVKATMQAVKEQFPSRPLIAVLELHTYSSLSVAFMPHYAGALAAADVAAVFYSPHALAIKKMPPLPIEAVLQGFNKPGLQVFTSRPALEAWLVQQPLATSNVLLMSSGTYDGLDIAQLAVTMQQP